MLKKLQSDDDDLMEIFQQHYAELRRERSEYKDTVHKLAGSNRNACSRGIPVRVSLPTLAVP